MERDGKAGRRRTDVAPRRSLLVTDYRSIGWGVVAESGVGYCRFDKKREEVLVEASSDPTHTNNTQQTDQNDDS